jgi:methyl-accepting chemotaxis protein
MPRGGQLGHPRIQPARPAFSPSEEVAVSTKNDNPRPPARTAPVSDGRPQAADDLGAGNLDKVRDILFGGQMRDYERRFQRMDERLAQDTAELKEEVRRRLSSLEQFVRQETESLAQRIRSEQEERSDATKEITREAREAAKAFEKKAGLLDDQIGRVQRESRQQMLELEQRMQDDLGARIQDVLSRLSRESGELRADKTDRATLAALLTEMAMRLNNELRVPGMDDGLDA